MALTAIVTKKSVNYVQEKMHNITFHLSVLDGAVEVLSQDFTCQYAQGDNPAKKVAQVLEEINIFIARYKAEQQIFNSAALNNAVASIQSGVIL